MPASPYTEPSQRQAIGYLEPVGSQFCQGSSNRVLYKSRTDDGQRWHGDARSVAGFLAGMPVPRHDYDKLVTCPPIARAQLTQRRSKTLGWRAIKAGDVHYAHCSIIVAVPSVECDDMWMTRAAVALCVGIAAALAGCTATHTPSPEPTSLRLPAGISVAVLQQRSDYGPRRVHLAVANTSKRDVVVRGLTLTTDYLTSPVVAEGLPYAVSAGTTIHFPAVLTAPDCAASAANPSVDATVIAGGQTVTARVIPTQPFDSLEVVHASDCSRASFESVVRIELATVLQMERTTDGTLVSVLAVRLVPTGAAGTVTLTSIGGTILLDVASSRELPITMSAASPARTLSVRAVPTRCDPHVVAEDKVGTILPFRVSTGEYPAGEFGLAVPIGLRNQYLTFVATACGW